AGGGGCAPAVLRLYHAAPRRATFCPTNKGKRAPAAESVVACRGGGQYTRSIWHTPGRRAGRSRRLPRGGAEIFNKGGCLMKTMLKVVLGVAVAVALVAVVKAADKEVTKSGKLVCGKCTL